PLFPAAQSRLPVHPQDPPSGTSQAPGGSRPRLPHRRHSLRLLHLQQTPLESRRRWVRFFERVTSQAARLQSGLRQSHGNHQHVTRNQGNGRALRKRSAVVAFSGSKLNALHNTKRYPCLPRPCVTGFSLSAAVSLCIFGPPAGGLALLPHTFWGAP